MNTLNCFKGGRKQDDEDKEEKRRKDRERKQRKRSQETPEEREKRLEKMKAYIALRKKNETDEKRQQRLAHLRRNQQIRLQEETEQEKHHRLAALRQNKQIRLQEETEQEKQHRLAALSRNQQIRLQEETEQEKQHRLAALSQNQKIRLKEENAEERERRLTVLKENKESRLANESGEDKQERLILRAEWYASQRASRSVVPSQIFISKQSLTDAEISPEDIVFVDEYLGEGMEDYNTGNSTDVVPSQIKLEKDRLAQSTVSDFNYVELDDYVAGSLFSTHRSHIKIAQPSYDVIDEYNKRPATPLLFPDEQTDNESRSSNENANEYVTISKLSDKHTGSTSSYVHLDEYMARSASTARESSTDSDYDDFQISNKFPQSSNTSSRNTAAVPTSSIDSRFTDIDEYIATSTDSDFTQKFGRNDSDSDMDDFQVPTRRSQSYVKSKKTLESSQQPRAKSAPSGSSNRPGKRGRRNATHTTRTPVSSTSSNRVQPHTSSTPTSSTPTGSVSSTRTSSTPGNNAPPSRGRGRQRRIPSRIGQSSTSTSPVIQPGTGAGHGMVLRQRQPQTNTTRGRGRGRGNRATRGLSASHQAISRARMPWMGVAKRVDVRRFKESELPQKFHYQFEGCMWDTVCPHCKAYRWPKEMPGTCCMKGTVRLPTIPPPPDDLIPLYNVNGTFLKSVTAYNNVLALASLGCNEIKQPGFNPTFVIQGKIYHLIGSLLPDQNQGPKFAQLYFYDTENETENRMQIMNRLNREILTTVQNSLHLHNPYIASFKSGLEMLQESPDVRLVLHSDHRPSDEHVRRYNLPTASEVGALLPGETTGTIDVILHGRSGELKRICSNHRSYDPLHYVLLFPTGLDGFQFGMRRSNNKTLTALDFYSYRFQLRETEWNIVMKCRRLMQQYAVDMWAKIEVARLDWVKRNQQQIRADKYNGLLDAQASNDLANAGRKVILPPTVYGTPRFYSRCFQDAMAIVRKLGKPDLFVTFTCNPKWQEIQQSLNEGESYTDRPDLCVRVFKMKAINLLADIVHKQIFGKVKGYTATIEFQKRGLPHIHIVIILVDEHKPRTPEAVDSIVCAEIPDRDENPELYNIVTKNMIHGPCGNINRNCVCMKGDGQDRKCSKGFPMRLATNTVLSQTNYPKYRRKSVDDGGNVHRINFGSESNPNYFHVDNSWVVPYNPLLSLRYKAHINVEVVYSTQAVKYLYKYITKGQDRVIMDLHPDNEVERYQNARYISASEAFWRIYEFELHHRYPPVTQLACHLEGEQSEVFREGEQERILEQGPKITTLDGYFKANATDQRAQNILYPDFPEYYTWDKTAKSWKRRVRGTSIGRIPVITLNPHQSELFYLRLLLHNKTGATSFTDLQTVNGEICDTYQLACQRLGLLESDDELDTVMEEAGSIRFGDQLRDVFANILIYSRPSDPLEFWNRHRVLLCQDYMMATRIITRWHSASYLDSNITQPTARMCNEVLLYLQDRFQQEDMDLVKNFGLPAIDQSLLRDINVPRIIREETSYDTQALATSIPQRLTTLNDAQRQLYDAVMHSVDNDEGKIFGLQASGGTGKTYTLNIILDTIRSRGDVALATAISGIAATLLNNGRTLHRRCKIPININENSTANFTRRDATGQLMKLTKILIVDEVGMGHKHVYEALDRSLRDVREVDKLFGGMTVLFATDWRQVLPVVPKGGRGQIVNASLKTSYIWQRVKIFRLTVNMRVQLIGADREFSNYLMDCGDGKLPIQLDLGSFKVKVPAHLNMKGTLDDLCDWVFYGLSAYYQDASWSSSRSVICPCNKTVDLINNKMMDKYPGDEKIYKSYDSVTEETHIYPTEYLNTLCTSGMPPHKLKLKVGCPIMLMRNMNPHDGHCNGTKYIITRLHDNVIEAVIANGSYAGNRLFIPRIPIKPTENTFPFQLTRKQFPIRPCFAITSNKAQGQTLKKVGVYINSSFFSHGQYYVAQSRVGDATHLKILVVNGTYPQKDGTYTDNVVYPEVLDS